VGGDADALRALAGLLPATGVTTFLPTVISAGAALYRATAKAWAAARSAPGARMPGLHLEGPLLSPARGGVHERGPIDGADAALDDVLDELLAAHALRVMTIAPERAGALDRIRRLCAAGVTVSLGHTDASYDEMRAGIDAGATLCTHLYSGMSPLHHRAPGAVGAALTDDRLTAALIPDGIHAHAAALALALRAKGPAKIALTTDAISAAGAPAGTYALAGMTVVSDGTSARLADGTLAGSTLTMDRAVRNMVALAGARIEDALAMASTVPAALIGLSDSGRLAVNQRADLVLWSPKLEVTATLIAGEVAFDAKGE
jgi:N-acetylglucosamine-6-phosphate deacetylase